MDFILTVHGLVRWVVALLALTALIKFGLGWVRKGAFASADRGIMSAYTGFLDLNLLLGLILFFFYQSAAPRRLEHVITMIIAIVIAHASAAWRKSDDAVKKFRNNFLVVLVSILLIFSAVTQLRGGWVF